MTGSPVLIVEDDPNLRGALADTLDLAGFDTVVADNGESALDRLGGQPVAAVVTDVQMKPMDGRELLRRLKSSRPDLPVLVMTAYGTIQDAVEAMREGASDYLVKPFAPEALLEKVTQLISADGQSTDMIAEDPATVAVVDLARRVAESDATVLLTGESGTGKEVFARLIHAESPRAEAPFVAINCAAIPDNMLEDVLFGHEKGAFTGAQAARAGKFEQAQGGTLLLDEISEMSLDLQAKLLRVLQEREVERLGGNKAIRLDVRVLATTNRDLRACVGEGTFREDLYYRLSVFPLELPALRARPKDILPLVRRFLARLCDGQRPVPEISLEAEQKLLGHAWPGNVRELQNLTQRALILCPGDRIDGAAIRFECVSAGTEEPAPEEHSLGADLKSREASLILDALKAGNGSRKHAAEALGISPRTLRYKLARMRDAGIPVPGPGLREAV